MKYDNFEEVKKAKENGELEDAFFFIDNDYLKLERKTGIDEDGFAELEDLYILDGADCSRILLKKVLEMLGFDVEFA